MTAEKAPHFLCIGAPKVGSTWIFSNLKAHPDIWLPPCKSIHYFYEHKNNLKRGKKLRQLFFRILLKESSENKKWYAKFFLNPFPNDKWYLSLFSEATDKVCGEISASYVTMSQKAVKHAYSIAPHAKIIFFMRDPIERAWSQAIMDLVRIQGKDIDAISDELFIKNFDKQNQVEKTDYVRVLRNWRSHYPQEQMFCGFQEEIRDNPDKLLKRMCTFIGVEYKKSYFPTSSKVVNKGIKHKIRPQLEKYLAEKYHPMLKELAQEFKGYPQKWLLRAEKILKK